MKKLEIVLKILFLASFVFLYSTYTGAFDPVSIAFLGISFLLGAVLIVNKDQSYGYPLSFHEVVERRIEGVLLVGFSLVVILLHVIN